MVKKEVKPKEENKVIEEVKQEQINKEVKPKKQLTQAQLDVLARAREKARQKKLEMGVITAKEKEIKNTKYEERKKEIEEKYNQIKTQDEPPKPVLKPVKTKKIIRKIIEHSDNDESDDEAEIQEVIIKKKSVKKATPTPEPTNIIDNNVNMLLRNKLQQQREQNYMKLLQNMM